MSCYTCKNFSELKEPKVFDEYSIFGYCFKKNPHVHEQYPCGHPVYIPGGSCKGFQKDPSKHNFFEKSQLELEGVFK